ncbi:MAG: CaiB/BaiF CoA transferase family protein [Candidatus Micropelagos thuwalensis]|tara:strand:+ start:224 stop:1414 length:1191 start_codon:yes stop_codon:yes gene_type:complete
MTGPLDGIRVIEFTSVVLGPFACQILGDLGADVIKVEPPGGDTNRNLGPVKNTEGLAALFLTCNRNKKSIVLDLKSDEGREAALKLIATADVVVHNFRPKAMEKLGLDYQAVKKVNPDIIYCATYGFSKKGPYGDKGALDDSIQAASGVAMLMKMVEGEPRYLPTIIGDKTTGLNVANAVTSALFHRERKGKGQEIEVPMFETMVSYVMVEHLWGQVFEPPLAPAGYTRLMSKHRRPYKTKDGYIAVLPYWDNHWATFCKLIDREDMISDERFINMKSRLENIDITYSETGKALAKRTTDEWLEALSDTNVPHMHVSELDDLMQNQHLIESEFWEMHQHPTEGTLRMPKLPIYFSESPASIRLMPPKLGAHNDELLSEIGYSEDEINALKEKGITS